VSQTGWRPSTTQLDRIAYRRQRTVRSVTISAVSTIVLGAIVIFAVTHSPGWPRVKSTYFDVHYGWSVLPDIAKGLWLNVRIMVVCEVFILAFAMLLAIARTLRGPVFFPIRAAATIYVDLFRGLPQLVVLLACGFGIPALQLQGLPISTTFWGGVALILTYSAYVAEVLRAGMESVHPSQRAAARSLGLSHAQSLRYVVIPQGVRRVVPALLNDLVSLQKDTSLVSILGVVEAIQTAQIDIAKTFNYTPLVVASILFVLLTIPMTRFTDWLATRRGTNLLGGGIV
jgi:polar amino acid transport system permease protein